MNTHTRILRITSAEFEKVDRFLNPPEGASEEDFLPEDKTISWAVDFGDGIEVDIKVCGAHYEPDERTNARVVGMLFDNGCEVSCTCPDDDLSGEYLFTYKRENYKVIVDVEGKEMMCRMRRTVGDLDLLRTYMKTKFPRGLYAVLDFYAADSGVVTQRAIETFWKNPDHVPSSGLYVWEIGTEFEAKIMQDFNKSGLDIWIFLNGELINETR